MNKTMQSMMKPIDPSTLRANSEDTKRAQEAVVMTILRESPYSMKASKIASKIDLPSFPGYNPYYRTYLTPAQRGTRMVSCICRRLESKGEIISTLYQGYRLYSIPVQNGGED